MVSRTGYSRYRNVLLLLLLLLGEGRGKNISLNNNTKLNNVKLWFNIVFATVYNNNTLVSTGSACIVSAWVYTSCWVAHNNTWSWTRINPEQLLNDYNMWCVISLMLCNRYIWHIKMNSNTFRLQCAQWSALCEVRRGWGCREMSNLICMNKFILM